MAKKEDTASVLAFEKKLVSSDGYMYGTNWETKTESVPLHLQEKSVRGTISNRQPPGSATSVLGSLSAWAFMTYRLPLGSTSSKVGLFTRITWHF